MPLGEHACKEALRAATDWLFETDPPGAATARDGIANVIPLVLMGAVEPRDLDDLASIVEDNAAEPRDPGVAADVHRAQLHDAVRAAFDHVKSLAPGS